MNELNSKELSFLNGRYTFKWKEKNSNVIVAEFRHVVKNEFGGQLITPIGILLCYKEETPEFWRVKLLYRNDIKYSESKNRTFVFSKSAHRFNLRYYITVFMDLIRPKYRVDKRLLKDVEKYLLEHAIIQEPYSISEGIQTEKNFRFVGEVDGYD